MPVPTAEHCNEMRLVGRVADEPTAVVLPSGDELVSARLIVERPRPPAGQGRSGKVDTFACAAWPSVLRWRMRVWSAGDTVEVTGAMRRRFWRGPTGVQSRYEVEVTTARLVARAPVADDRATDESAATDNAVADANRPKGRSRA